MEEPPSSSPFVSSLKNRLSKDDKLLLAFDALVLSEMLGRAGSVGKIIHRDDYSTLKVKTASLSNRVGKLTEEIAALLSAGNSPDLVLKRHCGECEFQTPLLNRGTEAGEQGRLGHSGPSRPCYGRYGQVTRLW